MSNGKFRLRSWAVMVVFLTTVTAARTDLIVTNGSGVQAGISGITKTNGNPNSVGIKFFVSDPSGTNQTTFTIQRSSSLSNWADYSASVIVTGSFGPAVISDFATNRNDFYRMRLINFQ